MMVQFILTPSKDLIEHHPPVEVQAQHLHHDRIKVYTHDGHPAQRGKKEIVHQHAHSSTAIAVVCLGKTRLGGDHEENEADQNARAERHNEDRRFHPA